MIILLKKKGPSNLPVLMRCSDIMNSKGFSPCLLNPMTRPSQSRRLPIQLLLPKALKQNPKWNILSSYIGSTNYYSDLSGSVTKGSCSILEVAVNGAVVTVADDEEEDDI